MAKSETPDFETDESRDRLMGEVLNDFLDRRARGDPVQEADLYEANPGIAPELSKYLGLLQTLRPVTRAIDQLVAQGVLSPADDGRYAAMLGEYGIIRLLGQGGVGIVLLAYDEALQRNVALKLLRPELSADRLTVVRFAREATTAASLRHPNIVTVHAVGQAGGMPYFAMEYVDGPTLAEVIQDVGPLAPDRVRAVFSELLLGLDAAHCAGVIHRDIKPSNILLDGPDQRVKIADFGLARTVSAQTRITLPEAVFGTPAYMSPEQARGADDIDHRSDLYSAGVVLYEMLTGRVPFNAKNSSAVVHQILYNDPPSPSTATTDPILASLSMCLMAKDPADRVQSAAEATVFLESGKPIRFPARRRRFRKYMAALMFVGLALCGTFLVVSQLAPEPRIADVRIDESDPTHLLAKYAGDEIFRPFVTWPLEDAIVADPQVVDLDTSNEQLIVFGVRTPRDGECLFASDRHGSRVWGQNLSDDREWPDSNLPLPYWNCTSVLKLNTDSTPDEEIVVVATYGGEYATRVSVVAPDEEGTIGPTFWHMGTLGNVDIVPGFFGPERAAILAWGCNNKLDGFNDGLRGDERQFAHWDIVPVVTILDPTDLAGIGPPPTGRVPHPSEGALPYAYAFLDLPTKSSIIPVRQANLRVDEPIDGLTWRQNGAIKSVREWNGPDRSGRGPRFEVVISGRTGDVVVERAILVVDRHLQIVSVRPNITVGEATTREYWEQHWHVIIKEGKYVAG